MEEPVKICIIGGGISGTSVAIRLAQKGFYVTIYEKEKFPRDIVGEGLSPAIIEYLKELDIFEDIESCANVVKKVGLQLVSPDGSKAYTRIDMSVSPYKDGLHNYPYGYNVKRKDFDNVFMNKAKSLGVKVYEETPVKKILIEEGKVVGVEVLKDNKKESFIYDLVVDCSGRNSIIAKEMSLRGPLENVFEGQWANFAIRCHFKNVDFSHLKEGINNYSPTTVNIFPDKDCWFWFIPLDDKEKIVSIGFVARYKLKKLVDSSLDKMSAYRKLIEAHPVLKKAVKNAEMLENVVATSRLGHMNTKMCGDGFVCVGDSAFFADPAWGTGATIALKTAKMATETILKCIDKKDFSENALQTYEDDYLKYIEAPFNSIRVYNHYYNDIDYVNFIVKNLHDNQKSMDMIGAIIFDYVSHEAFQSWTYSVFKKYYKETGRFPVFSKVSQFDFESGKVGNKSISEILK